MRWLGVALLLTGCDDLFGLDHVSPERDARPDVAAPVRNPFDAPIPLNLNTAGLEEDDPSLTDDLLEMYLLRGADLWRSTRTGASELWSQPVLVPELNTTSTELRPAVSGDGLTLYFARTVVDQRDIFVTKRANRTDPWSPPQVLALDLNRLDSDELPGSPSPDGLRLLVESSAIPSGEHQLYLATRPALDAPFTSVPLDALNTSSNDSGAWATADGTTIMFDSNRSGGVSTNIWEAIRVEDTWFLDERVELASPGADGTPWLSPDGRIVVFSSNRAGTDDLYMARRP